MSVKVGNPKGLLSK